MRRNILVVDDEHAIRMICELALEDDGYEVTTAKDGSEALARVMERVPDAIVLDISMPVMDGPTFLNEARKRGISSPVLVLSAYDARRRAAELGAEKALDKPFLLDDLVDAVSDLVRSDGH